MPTQDCLGFDNEEGLVPVLESAGEQDEETTLGSCEVWTFDRAVKDDELLAEQRVFNDQFALTPAQVCHRAVDE